MNCRHVAVFAPEVEGEVVHVRGNRVFDLLAVLIAPIAYYYVGRTKWAVINLLTLNYLLLGVVIAPIHVYTIVSGSDS